MSGNDIVFMEGVVEKFEVRFLEERFGGIFGVGGVGDDDVEGVFVVIKEFEVVVDVDFDFGVVEVSGYVGEVLFGEVDDGL